MHSSSRDSHDDPRVGLVLVGFSPSRPLTAIARSLGWDAPVLADAERVLYRALGLGRAPWWRVYSPATLATYARAAAHGHRPTPPREDTRQLGGDAVLRDGRVVVVWRPRSPDDRPGAEEVLARARQVAAEAW